MGTCCCFEENNFINCLLEEELHFSRGVGCLLIDFVVSSVVCVIMAFRSKKEKGVSTFAIESWPKMIGRDL